LALSASILLDVEDAKCAKEREERKGYSGMLRKEGTYKSATQRTLMEVLPLVTYENNNQFQAADPLNINPPRPKTNYSPRSFQYCNNWGRLFAQLYLALKGGAKTRIS
jgi:hypothetical protein